MTIRIAAILPLAFFLNSCARSVERSPEPEKRYSIHGEVVRLDNEGKLATIKHQKIEGWMEAMTMTFPVKDPNDFSSLQVDRCIDATVVVQGDNFWIGDVKKLDTPPENCVALPGAPPPAAKP